MNAARKGKIARLPRDIRDQLNRRLHDGGQGKRLVGWLNALPEVQAVMAAEFAGRPIREQNISEWRKGGYSDWLAQQEALDVVRRVTADADDLQQGATEPLTDKLAPWIVARHFVAAKALAGENGQVDWKLLRELCNDVVALRRGDHYAERLRIERQRLEHECARGREQSEAEIWEWVLKPENRDRINEEFEREAEEQEERLKEMQDKFRVVVQVIQTPPPTSPAGAGQPPPAESDPVRPDPTESNPIQPDQTNVTAT
jgi:hypothetical protein